MVLEMANVVELKFHLVEWQPMEAGRRREIKCRHPGFRLSPAGEPLHGGGHAEALGDGLTGEASASWAASTTRWQHIPIFSHIGSGRASRTASGRVLALGAPAVPGGNIGRGWRRRRNVGQRGAKSGSFRSFPVSTRSPNWCLRRNPKMAALARTEVKWSK